MAVGRSKPVERTSFWKVSVFATVTFTGVDTVVLLSVSRARAASTCAPFGVARVSQLAAYGATVSSGPCGLPSTKNWTPATPTSSLASAWSVRAPETTSPSAGEVTETLGAVESAGPALSGRFMSAITSSAVSARL